MDITIPKKGTKLVPCIPLEDTEVIDVDKTFFVSFDLKILPNGDCKSTYEKTVRRFSEGSPVTWIQTMMDINEIWVQNGVVEGSDRAAIVRTILRDDALTVFEGALEGQLEPIDDDEDSVKTTPEKVNIALEAVSASVFPHRALEVQKLWMRRHMKKPSYMAYRALQAKVMKMNRCLAMFPDATEESKFSNAELLEILEFALPATWRAKFDLNGYVPTRHNIARLLIACEAIERNEVKEVSKDGKRSSKIGSTRSKEKEKKVTTKSGNSTTIKGLKHCSEHGMNSTHDSSSCWILHPKLKPAKFVEKTNNKKTKELNVLLKGTYKKELLNMLSNKKTTTSEAKAKKKNVKEKASKKRKQPESDTSDESIHQMDQMDTPLPSEDEENEFTDSEPEPDSKRIKKLGKSND